MNFIKQTSKLILGVLLLTLAFNIYAFNPARDLDYANGEPEIVLRDVFLVHIDKDGEERVSSIRIEKDKLIFPDELGSENLLKVRREGRLLLIKDDEGKDIAVVPLLRRVKDPKRLTFLNNLGIAIVIPKGLKHQALRFIDETGAELYAPMGLTRESLLFMDEMGGVIRIPFIINGSALIFTDTSGRPFDIYVGSP